MEYLTGLVNKSSAIDREMVDGIKNWFDSFGAKLKLKPKSPLVQDGGETILRTLKPNGVTVGSFNRDSGKIVGKNIYTLPYEELDTKELRWTIGVIEQLEF